MFIGFFTSSVLRFIYTLSRPSKLIELDIHSLLSTSKIAFLFSIVQWKTCFEFYFLISIRGNNQFVRRQNSMKTLVFYCFAAYFWRFGSFDLDFLPMTHIEVKMILIEVVMNRKSYTKANFKAIPHTIAVVLV